MVEAAGRASGRAPGSGSALTVGIVSSKGGVGKTAVATGLAAALARQGLRTLVVDADPQGNATVALGVQPGRTLAHALMEGAPLTTAIVEARPGLSLVPADRTVAALEGWLHEDGERRWVLRRALAELGGIFDAILMDTAPGHSLLNVACYVAVDGLVVPCTPDGLALHGVRGVEENRVLLAEEGLPAPPIVLAVPTLADRRHGRTALVLDALMLHFRERVGPPFRVCSAVAIAMANGRTVHEYAPRSTAAEDLDALAVRLRAVVAIGATTATAPAAATAATAPEYRT